MIKQRSTYVILACYLAGTSVAFAGEQTGKPKGYSIPLIDLAAESERQVIVDREPGQFLGTRRPFCWRTTRPSLRSIRKDTDEVLS
jgi:hypothetical protein